jgi:hypothetical protein
MLTRKICNPVDVSNCLSINFVLVFREWFNSNRRVEIYFMAGELLELPKISPAL